MLSRLTPIRPPDRHFVRILTEGVRNAGLEVYGDIYLYTDLASWDSTRTTVPTILCSIGQAVKLDVPQQHQNENDDQK